MLPQETSASNFEAAVADQMHVDLFEVRQARTYRCDARVDEQLQDIRCNTLLRHLDADAAIGRRDARHAGHPRDLPKNILIRTQDVDALEARDHAAERPRRLS